MNLYKKFFVLSDLHKEFDLDYLLFKVNLTNLTFTFALYRIADKISL